MADKPTSKAECAPIYTIGHSNHDLDRFVSLLKVNGIEFLADVRSTPASRYSPQFDRQNLEQSGDLCAVRIRYVYLGDLLGGRPADKSCWVGSRVSYAKMAESPAFLKGIERVISGANQGRTIALMCSEKEPLECHRFLAISRVLAVKGVDVRHILEDGTAEPHHHAELCLLKQYGLDNGPGLFETDTDYLAKAYSQHEMRMGYRRTMVDVAE